MSVYDKIFPPKTITLANGKTVQRPRSRMPLIVLVLLVVLLLKKKLNLM